MTFAARPLWFLGENPNATVLVGGAFGTGQTGTVGVQAGSIEFTPTGVAGTGVIGSVTPVTGFTSYTNPIGFDGSNFSTFNYSNAQAAVQLIINTEGTWTVNLTGWDLEQSTYTGNWGNPTTPSGGNNLYYRYILNTVTTTGSAGQTNWTPGSPAAPYTSTWIGGGGGNIINLLVSATKVGSGTVTVDTSYTVQISTTASTAGLVAQGTIVMGASSTSNDPP